MKTENLLTWLDAEIEIEKNSHDEWQESDDPYVEEVYQHWKNLLAIRARLLAAQQVVKCMKKVFNQHGIQTLVDTEDVREAVLALQDAAKAGFE